MRPRYGEGRHPLAGRGRIRPVGRTEAQDVPLDGAQRRQPGVGQPVDGAEAGPGGQDDQVRAEPAAVRQDELGTGRRRGWRGQRGHGRFDERDAAPAAGLHQRAEERTVVDVMVAGDLDPAAQGGAERRDQGAALAGTPTVGFEAERVLVGEEVVEAGSIGRIERHGHGPRRVVADGVAGGALQRGGEGRPAPRPLDEESRQGGLAELRLGHRGQHPGRHPRRAVTPGGGRNHRHFMTVA